MTQRDMAAVAADARRGAARQTLSDLLRRSAARRPDATAIVCGEVRWTYREFDALCTRLASGLARRGIVQGDRVAVLARNSHFFALLRYALARIGAVIVPVSFMLQRDEVRFILEHSGATVLCTDAGFADLARAAAPGTAVRELLGLPSDQAVAAPAGMPSVESLYDDAPLPEGDFDSRSPAQIIYTSGTESLPKGALLSHEAIIWQYVTLLADAEFVAADRMLHAMPLYHCAQLDAFLGPLIYVGATNVITAQPNADNLLTLLERHRVTSFFAPPTVWISLLRSPRFDTTDLSALTKAYYGASIMPVVVLHEIQRRLPSLRLWNFYGQTEIAPTATFLLPADQVRKAGSVGRPGLNVETRIVDDMGRDCPVGEVGEIVHRSPQLLDGYYRDPEKTAAAFRGGWFHSGDLARIDDEGYITIVDRMKDMIKSGGENVASREVEEHLYRLPQVAEAAVIGLPHPLWVEGVVAVIVVRKGHELTEDEVIGHCHGTLARFKSPKRVLFVAELPKTPSGKVLKRDLREQLGSIEWAAQR